MVKLSLLIVISPGSLPKPKGSFSKTISKIPITISMAPIRTKTFPKSPIN